MKRNRNCNFILLIFVIIINCDRTEEVRLGKEMVMVPGMKIKATNKNGTINIRATDTMEREYSWKEYSVTVDLIPRTNRWYGSLGAYKPSGEKNIHTIVEEGQQHFCSIEEANDWLFLHGSKLDFVWTNDGLAIGWYSTKGPGNKNVAIGVKVWQIYIMGQKPDSIPGAKERKIEVRFNGKAKQIRPVAKELKISKPRFISGRMYAGKALDIMEERGFNASKIQQVIEQGHVTFSSDSTYSTYTLLGNNGFGAVWVTIDSSGKVLLVGG